MIDGVFQPGDVEIESVSLVLNDDREVFITTAFVSIQIYEDLFSNCIHGMVTMADSVNLIGAGPLYGGEGIRIKMKTPGLEKQYTVDYTGIVYKITDLLQATDKLQNYMLHFTSTEAVINENKKVSRHFKGNIADHIKFLFRDDTALATDARLVLTETGSTIEFASPYWSPFKIANWIATRAMTRDKLIPDYVLYETLSDGFVFNSISLMMQKPSIFRYIDGNRVTDSIQDQYENVKSMYITDVADYMRRVQDGTLASRLVTANVMSKTLQMSSLTSAGYFPKTPHLNKFDLLGPETVAAKNAMMVSFIDQEYGYNTQRDLGFKNWLLQRNQIFGRLNNSFKVDMDVNGRFDIRVGRVCDIIMERPSSIASVGDDQTAFMTGRYLITAVCHTITPDRKHNMAVQCLTDSVNTELKRKKAKK